MVIIHLQNEMVERCIESIQDGEYEGITLQSVIETMQQVVVELQKREKQSRRETGFYWVHEKQHDKDTFFPVETVVFYDAQWGTVEPIGNGSMRSSEYVFLRKCE